MATEHGFVLDWNCSTVECLLMQWVCEECPQATTRTAIVADRRQYVFDGFYLLSHQTFSHPPPFEYVRDDVKCTLTFDNVALPTELVGPHVRLCLSGFQDYLLWQLLRIPSSALFPDSSPASDNPTTQCAPFHIYPRFVAVDDASHHDMQRMGFLSGSLLSIDVIMDYLHASAKCSAAMFLAEFSPEALMHHVLAYEDGPSHAGCFRVDIVTSQRQVLHDGHGAKPLDGVVDPSRVHVWRDVGPLDVESPEVPSVMKVLHPNVSYLTGLKCDVFELASALPLVFRFLKHCAQLDAFEAQWHLRFQDKSLLRQAFTHVSYVECGVQHAGPLEAVVGRVQMGHTIKAETQNIPSNGASSKTQMHQPSHYLCPGGRLKFLGDAVLSFLVSSNSFCQFPDVSESHLRELRTKIINNDTVGDLAKTCHLDQLILTSFNLANVDEELSNAVAADCVKAILGAIFYEQGWAEGVVSARSFLRQLFVEYDPELADFMFLLSRDLADKVKRELDGHDEAAPQHSAATHLVSRHKQFLAVCPIRIDRTHLWLQAMTHKSFKGSADLGGDVGLGKGERNNERLAFLGESILQVVASRVLMDMFPYHQDDLLSTVRTTLLSRSRLDRVGASIKYEPFIQLGGQPNAAATAEVVADVFAACLGAMYLEQLDLHAVEHFLHTCLFPLVPDAVADREWLGPKQRFLDHVRQWPQKCRVSFEPLEATDKDMHAISLSVNGHVVCRAMAATKEIAANNAAMKALQLFGL